MFAGKQLTVFNVAGRHTAGLVKVNSNEFAKTRRVVVTHRLRVTEGLQHRVSLDNLVLERSAFSATLSDRRVGALLARAHRCKIGNHLKYFSIIKFAISFCHLALQINHSGCSKTK